MRPLIVVPTGGLGLSASPRVIPPLRSISGSTFIPSAPAVITQPQRYPPAPTGGFVTRTLTDAASLRQMRLTIDVVNRSLQGKLNVTYLLTLAADADTTIITDPRIGATSGFLFCPLSADAAAEIAAGTLYVQSQVGGSATIAHANNAQTDRNFRVIIIG